MASVKESSSSHLRQRLQTNASENTGGAMALDGQKCPFVEVPRSGKASNAVSKPHREIPGSYGTPFFGPLKDKLDYFALKGWYKYVQDKVDLYQSTVLKVNWPSFNGEDSKVVLLLDQSSYPILYDNEKVDKTDLFFSPGYLPDLGYTDGVRICTYLDTADKSHTQAKGFCKALLSKYGKNAHREISERTPQLFADWDAQIQINGVAEVFDTLYEFNWAFLAKTFNFSTILPKGGHTAKSWAGPQVLPIINLGAPLFVEALVKLLISKLPTRIVKKDLKKLVDYVRESGGEAVQLGVEHGLSEHEAVVHLMYFIAFNAHPALLGHWASVLTAIGLYGGEPLMGRLAEEVRSAVATTGKGDLTTEVIANLPLFDSVIYETMRIRPVIMNQYGRASEDLKIESHDATYTIPKGQVIAGHLYWTHRDPVVFKDPDNFIADRFMGTGQSLLPHLLWSNGRQTEEPGVSNKQCPAKDFVVEWTKIFLANFFRKYKAYELAGNPGWDPVRTAPGPGLTENKLGTQKLLIKNLRA